MPGKQSSIERSGCFLAFFSFLFSFLFFLFSNTPRVIAFRLPCSLLPSSDVLFYFVSLAHSETNEWCGEAEKASNQDAKLFFQKRKELDDIWIPICRGQMEVVGGIDGKPYFIYLRQPKEGGPYYPKSSKPNRATKGSK